MEGSYPQGIAIALTDCTDTAKEEVFMRWYDEIKIPELEALGFIRSTKRYKNVLGDTPTYRGRPKYLAIWSFYHNDLKQARAELSQRSAAVVGEGKGSVSANEVVTYPQFSYVRMVDTLYSEVGPEFRTERTGRPVTGVHLVLSFPTDPAREDEFNKWYNEKHVPEVLAIGLYDTAYRYKILDPNDRLPYRPYYAAVYETSMDPLEAHQKLESYRSKWLEDPVWVGLHGVYWSGGFRQIYPPLER